MNLTLLLQHSLLYGLILSAVMAVVIFGSLRWNPEIWLNDYPPDIRAKYGPVSAGVHRQRRIVSVPFFGLLFGLVFVAIAQWARVSGAPLAFWPAFLVAFLMLETANLVDLLIFDWLIMVKLRPRSVILPGTEGMKGYDDYAFHFYGFLKGTAGLFVASLIIGGIAAGVAALLG